MTDQEPGRERESAREVAVKTFITSAVGFAFQVAVLVVLVNRDTLRRHAGHVRAVVTREWRGARERRMLAELQRDLSAISHAGRLTDDQ